MNSVKTDKSNHGIFIFGLSLLAVKQIISETRQNQETIAIGKLVINQQQKLSPTLQMSSF